MFPTQRTWHSIFSKLDGRFLDISLKDATFVLDKNSDKPCKEFTDDFDSLYTIDEVCIQDKANVSVVARVTSASKQATKITIGIAGFVDFLPLEETMFYHDEQDEYTEQCRDDMKKVYDKYVRKFEQNCKRVFAKHQQIDDFVVANSNVESGFGLTKNATSAYYVVHINLVLEPK